MNHVTTPGTETLAKFVEVQQEQRRKLIIERLALRHRRLESAWRVHLKGHREELREGK